MNINMNLCRNYFNITLESTVEISNVLNFINNDYPLLKLVSILKYNFFNEHSVPNSRNTFKKIKNYIEEKNIFYPEIIYHTIFCSLLPNLINYHSTLYNDNNILKDTLSDYQVWANKFKSKEGKIGIANYEWMCILFCGKIFKVGRLQFEIITFNKPINIYLDNNNKFSLKKAPNNKLVLTQNMNILNIHIQEGDSLSPDKILNSLQLAKEFFNQLGFPSKIAICSSWLLDTDLEIYGKDSPNILYFNRLFFKLPLKLESHAISRIFGEEFLNIDFQFLPEDSSLQKNLKKYLLNGDTPSDKMGIILL